MPRGVRFESKFIPRNMRRDKLTLPNVSEVEVVRHYIRLSQMSWGVDLGTYPLGSCTMKYNPKYFERNVLLEKIESVHPLQPVETVQGILKLLYELEKWLAEITGMKKGSFQPAAGAHGELTGALMIRKYHIDKGERFRDEIIIPDSAHGTNPASASMAGFKVITVPTGESGTIDLDALQEALSRRTAGIMLTNPNTLGIFEKDIVEVAKMIHDEGGLLYYDGANLNGIMGVARPGDMGFDIVHLNMHKTFAAPHGGGGPGACVVLAKGELVDYLPVPLVAYDGKRYYWDYNVPKTIGKVRAFYGNIAQLVRAYLYLLSLGYDGIKEVTYHSVLITNYFVSLLKPLRGIEVSYSRNRLRKHEVVISVKKLEEETGVSATDVAKALMDKGVHAPTVYFPLIVKEALMIEFTETESVDDVERYARYLREIIKAAYKNPEQVKSSPTNLSIKRLDEVKANSLKEFVSSYRLLVKRTANRRLS